MVGVLGGSFADGTVRGGSRQYFDKVISTLPEFENKEVVVYNMAMGAYKQPQQLMQLAYYLSLGAEFDLIINLDGFNEMAATYYGWRDAGLHPAFPKSWNHRVSSSLTREGLRAYSNKFQLLEGRSGLANFASGFPFRWSPMINVLWRFLDTGYVNRIANAELEGHQLSPEFLDGSWLLIIFAGNDTTRNTLSGAIKLLTENPDQKQKLIENPDLMPNFL